MRFISAAAFLLFFTSCSTIPKDGRVIASTKGNEAGNRESDLPYISNKIKNFRRELVSEIESGENHDSVYAFSIQFFRGDRESN